MRIVAGTLGGRNFEAPRGNRTHPMSEKIRNALFNALGDINGLNLLDGYSGSGAIAFEAISRGAKFVIAVEADKNAYDIIIKNRASLGVDNEKLQVILKRCESWSRQNSGKLFDVVVVDPPYNLYKYNYLTNERMTKHVKPGGIFVASIPPSHRANHDHGFNRLEYIEMIFEKDYGDAQLLFYKRHV
jgi:16S rRNA (guanine966-N2)-methyltransferase